MHKFHGFRLSLIFIVTTALMAPGMVMGSTLLSMDGVTITPLLTTSDDPANHLVTLPSFYDGVGKIIAHFPGNIGVGGSGSLLYQGGNQYLLTAAHLVKVGTSLITDFRVTFPNGKSYTASKFFLPPEWDGNFLHGYDIALVKFDAPVPNTHAYSILRDEITSPVTGEIAGYGKTGLGSTGITTDWGILHQGSNTFGEAYWDDINGSPYAFDFDSLPDKDPILRNSIEINFHVTSDLGLGNDEVMIARGDSGGPSFIDGKIGGVHSFGATFKIDGGDLDDVYNRSWGELGGDTRVVLVADWIDQVTAPLPAGVYLLASGLGLLLIWRRSSS